jgi:hypothetical protein
MRTWPRVVTVIGLNLALTGCGGNGGAKSAAEERESADTPDELNALFRRETKLPKPIHLEVAAAGFQADFPSTEKPTLEAGEGFTHVSFSLGTEEPAQCFFYSDTVDSGQSMTKMLAGLRENVEFTHVAPYRMATAQGLPIVFIEGRYVTNTEQGKVAGSIKLGITPRFVTPILCFLDEPGYADTFASAMTAIAKSIEVKEPKPEPRFSEVWAISLEDIPVGYQMLQVHDAGDGSVTAISLSASFIPTGPGELSTSDEVEVIQSDASGVLRGTFLEVEGTEVSHELNMARKGKAGYTVTGTVQGKEIKSEFKAPTLSDDVAFYRYLQKNHGKTGKVTVLEFAPSLDPTAPSKVTYEVDGPNGTVSHSVGDVVSRATLGESGLPSGMTLPIGVRELKGTVIHRQGTL